MFEPESPIVEPDAEELLDTLAPRSVIQLFSAAAPGAATDAVTTLPADVPKVTLLAFEKLRVWNVNEPAEFETAGAEKEAVIVPLFESPKVIPFELAKLTVPVFCEFAPADIAAPPPAPGAATDAEICTPALF